MPYIVWSHSTFEIVMFFLHNIAIIRRWGELVVTYPWPTIVSSLLVCAILSSGLILYRVETDQAVLWTPSDSPVSRVTRFDDV